MSRKKRIALVLVGLPLLAVTLIYVVHMFFAVVWVFLWWTGWVSDNSPPSTALQWVAGGLYCTVVAGFVAAIVASVRWVRNGPRD